jgi:D-serine deaminase-like pyridoxal phosphate-dependent protein
MTTLKTPYECPVHVVDEEALKRAIAKAKELADADPEKYRRIK